MSGKKSRDKGHKYEREIAKELRELGFEYVETSRYASRKLDNAKVDIYGMPMFNVQCKAVESLSAPHGLLKQMPDDENYNVVFNKKNNKGTIVVMMKEDFYEILTMLKVNKII